MVRITYDSIVDNIQMFFSYDYNTNFMFFEKYFFKCFFDLLEPFSNVLF